MNCNFCGFYQCVNASRSLIITESPLSASPKETKHLKPHKHTKILSPLTNSYTNWYQNIVYLGSLKHLFKSLVAPTTKHFIKIIFF